MTRNNTLSIGQRIALGLETLLMGFLVPKHHVGPIFGRLFKIPLLLRRLGFARLIPEGIMILTTTGRHSGKQKQTPVEFIYNADEDAYVVMSGWGGRTDWYRNACANPEVQVWTAGRERQARAEQASDVEVAAMLKEITQINPAARNIWSRWSDVEIDGSYESYLAAAPYFPVLFLHPVVAEEENPSHP